MNKFSFKLIMLFILARTFCYGQADGPIFIKHQLTSNFISEGVAVGDIDKDGQLDIIAGTTWFKGPQWIQHQIAPAKTYDGATAYSPSFLNYCMDVNNDGWMDVVVIGLPGMPALWYENNKNNRGFWKEHLILANVGVGNESPAFVDVDGDGNLDILCADIGKKQIVWLSKPVKKMDTVWVRHAISSPDAPGTDRYSHGLGLGDINKDGRKDVLIKSGWWQAPVNRRDTNWVYNPADFGEDCSQIYVLDVDGDGLNDVVNASAHKYGIWWHQQVKDANGTISWKQHLIDSSVSQTHGVSLADINGDGFPDIITGKRFFAHNDTDVDPGAHQQAMLYWFEYTPGKAPYFIRHTIDSNSGVGLHLVVQDMNKDHRKDLVISNKKGVFYFENKGNKN